MTSLSLKSVLLGSAAGILATAAAQAADLPVKKAAAAAVQYVKVCTQYGAGFYEMPGTDICVKHFGSFKFNAAWNQQHNAFDGRAQIAFEKHAADRVGWEWTARPGWDFRSPTEWGTLRLVIQARMDHRNGIMERVTPVDPSDDVDDVTGNQRPTFHRAYIEWAGWTIGRQTSQFVYWDNDDVISSVGGDATSFTTTQITYTWSLPGGIKATLGMEDTGIAIAGYQRNRATGVDIDAIGDGPQRWYDFVASLSTEQPWGSAKLSYALHQISVIALGADGIECVYDLDDNFPGSCRVKHTTGWAGLAGITLNLPWMGDGDQLLIQGIHADGAVAYAGVEGGADDIPSSFKRRGQWAGGLIRRDFDADIINNGDGDYRIEKEKATSLSGQLRHYWTPMLRSNLSANYLWLRPGETAKITHLSDGGRGDAEVLDVALNLIWGKSRKTAEIGIEVLYKKVKQDLPGPSFDAGVTSELPVGIEQNPDSWGVVGFIQRSY